MKLKTKLIGFLVLLTLFWGGSIIYFSKRGVHGILVGEVAKRGILKTTHLPEQIAPAFRKGDEDLLLSLLQTAMGRTDAIYAVALGPTGRVLAHSNVVEKGKMYTDSATQAALRSSEPGYNEITVNARAVVDVFLPVWSVRKAENEEEFLLLGGENVKEKTRLGTLRLGLPIQEALGTENRITTQIIWIMVMTGGIALGASLIFMRKVLLGLRLLIEGTERIGRGEYGALVPIRSKDELGILAQSFNRMSEDLTMVHEHLENEVRLRTQELESVVYTISHDLKSPIVSMQGMASILMEEYSHRLDEKGRHYLQRVIANTNYMEEMIIDLLALSRIGRAHQTPEPAEARSVIEKILDLNRERFEKMGVEIVLDPMLPRFAFDRTQLTELFQNLITNAAKFMGSQPHPRIEIGGRETGEWVQFYVKDNGIGIDSVYHEKIFGVFQRLKEIEVEGTGVGLSIAKKIVDLAQGKIWVESKKGEGATFFVRFPKTEAI